VSLPASELEQFSRQLALSAADDDGGDGDAAARSGPHDMLDSARGDRGHSGSGRPLGRESGGADEEEEEEEEEEETL
jgi:hypothetical protein